MRNLFKLVSFGLLWVSLTGISLHCSAQTTDDSTQTTQQVPVAVTAATPVQTPIVKVKKKHVALSARDSMRQVMLKRDALIRSFKHSDGSLNDLLGKIESYTNDYTDINNDLNQGFDTVDISDRLPTLERRMVLMKKTIETSNTMGYLITIRDMIDHVSHQTKEWQNQLDSSSDQLDNWRQKISDFRNDTTFKTVPADSALRAKTSLQIIQLRKKWKLLDSLSQKEVIQIGILENRVSALSILLIDLNTQIDSKIHQFTLNALNNEYGFIWDMHKTNSSARLDTALAHTYTLNSKLYKYFLTSKTNYYGHVACIILFICFFTWIYTSKRKLARIKDDHKAVFAQTLYIIKHPYATTILVVALLGPYFYDHPALVFTQTMLIIMTGMLGILIKSVWPKPLYELWRVLFVLVILFSISSLMILTTNTERVLLIVLSAIAIYGAYKLLFYIKRAPDDYPPYLSIILKIFIAINALSILLNIAGRFSLAKIGASMAVFNLCLGLGFYLLVQILMESLFLQLEANKRADNTSIASYIDFKLVQKKFKGVLIKVTALLWFVAFAKNLTIDDYLYDTVFDFLNDSHKFNSTAFTFKSILVFILVIWLSGMLARVISYFYDFAGQQQTKLTPQAKKTRSSILLIRLTIFIIGFFVAVNAAGIQWSEVTIVIGALGVGIGFGLQNLVNNLVSGIILAFEKPIQVGDVVEVSGKTGTITEIGIRSSKIDCGNGSELIVPNGDLISQHVVNWTLTNNNRQVELTIGVAYGSDVAKIDNILKDIINNHQEIMKTPAPAVLLNDFGENSINFKIFFWTEDIGKWAGLKSRVMSQVYSRFAKEGIEIAQPKQDIQIHFPVNPDSENPGTLTLPTKNPPEKDQ